MSWIRHRDIHLLTVGRYTYTSDQRFSAHHVPMTHFWQLRIRELNHRDAGKYECQVSTTPPRGHQMYLKVVGKMLITYYQYFPTVNFYHQLLKELKFKSSTKFSEYCPVFKNSTYYLHGAILCKFRATLKF